ncbi:hypothetical protein H9P43_007953 [Blastocladiella emersonii ATCC 22665]|nr:hypothetical protein H9P43_007953 [Blastocladiella emersonii ATCC 22665]
MFNLVPILTSIARPAGTRAAPSERVTRDVTTCFDVLYDVVYLGMLDGSVIAHHFNEGTESVALNLASATLPAKEACAAVVTQIAFGISACSTRTSQWDDAALALLKEVRFGPQYLMHMADPDHLRYGPENKKITAFLAGAKTVESFEAIANFAMHKLCGGKPSSLDPASVASLRASLDTSVNRFVLSYLDVWRSTSDAVNPAVEVARLHLLLKPDRGVQGLQRLADNLAARGHVFAESLVAQRAGDVRRQRTPGARPVAVALADLTPPATAAPGSEPRWVSVRCTVAQLLADLEYAADHGSNGPRDVFVRAYLAEGGSVASFLNKYRAAHVAFSDCIAAHAAACTVFVSVARSGDEVMVGRVRERLVPTDEFAFGLALLKAGRMVRVRQLGTETGDFSIEEVPLEVVVDVFLKMDGRGAAHTRASSCRSVAVKNMDVVNFRELANVLPSDWALERAAPLLMYELAQLARRHRWSTMVVKSLGRQRNMTTKLVMLAAAQEQPSPALPPAICAGCGRAIDHTDAPAASIPFLVATR